MGADPAARPHPPLRDFRQGLLDRGKPKKLAMIAVARKLLTILNAIARSGQPWRDAAA